MKYVRMPIEVESPEEFGYDRIKYNLSESSVRDRTLSEVGVAPSDLLLLYGEHRGHRGLIEAIARAANESAGGGPRGTAGRSPTAGSGSGGGPGGSGASDSSAGGCAAAAGPGAATTGGGPAAQRGGHPPCNVTPDDVLVTFGTAEALFIVATTLLEKGDQLVVVRPNYATNIFTPRAIEADIRYLDLTFEEQWAVDVDKLAALMNPRTKYVSVTVPHNPTGQVMSETDLRRIVELVEGVGCRLLVDETYREMTFGGPLPSAATLSPRAISVSSLSKTYGIPGIRTGWLICRDRELMETFLAAKEQIGICGSVVDEEIAYQALTQRDTWLPLIHGRIADAFVITRDWMAGEELMEWVEPRGGVVCFPRIRPEVPVDVDRFYRVLTEDFGTYVGPGHWFEQSRRHFRLGFGWPTLPELKGGLAGISAALRAARVSRS